MLLDIVRNPETLIIARKGEQFFTRNRKMSFEDLVLSKFTMQKTAIPDFLNNFFSKLNKGESMSQPAYSKARNNFDHSPFETMFRETLKDEYSGEYELPLYKGYHVFSVDGTHFNLPKAQELIEEFGTFGSPDSPMAGVSILYDVLHERVLDASIAHSDRSEREECEKHLDFIIKELSHIVNKVLLLLDRGYQSSDLFLKFHNSGIKFLCRCSSRFLSVVNDAPLGSSLFTLDNGLSIRVIKFILPTGEIETLVTNLYDMPEADFPKLYFMRWGIETMFDKLKNTVCIENFSGKTVTSINQDFWANLVLFNLAADFFDEANEIIKQEQEQKDKPNKHEYKARYTNLIVILRNRFITALYSGNNDSFGKELDNIIEVILNEAIRVKSPIRPNRSFKRKPKKICKFNHNLKSHL